MGRQDVCAAPDAPPFALLRPPCHRRRHGRALHQRPRFTPLGHRPAAPLLPSTEVKVPDIGDFKLFEVIEVLVNPGDAIANEQSLITLESDKATMEIPSPSA